MPELFFRRILVVSVASLTLFGVQAARAGTLTLLGAGFTRYAGPAANGYVENTGDVTTFVRVNPNAGTAFENSPSEIAVPVTPGTEGTPPLRPGLGYGEASFHESDFVDFYGIYYVADWSTNPPGRVPADPSAQEPENRIAFTPRTGPIDYTEGVDVLLGTFTLTNGAFWFDDEAGFDFQIRYRIDTTDYVLNDTIRYRSTPYHPSNSDEQNADFFYFEGDTSIGSMRVYELSSPNGNVGTIDVYGQIHSPLQITGFGDATGGVFHDPSVVPEPGAGLLVAAGLAALGAAGRRRSVSIRGVGLGRTPRGSRG